jgi:hypothetical protein
MKNVLVVGLLTVGMLAAVACGKPSKDDGASTTNTTAASVTGAKANCDMSAEVGSCNEYRNGSSFGLEKSLCEGFKGKFTLGGGCATTNQVGSCALSDGEVKRYYGTAVGAHGFTVDEAKSDCESEILKGKFTADPSAATAGGAAPKKDEPAPKAASPAVKAAAKPAAAKKK